MLVGNPIVKNVGKPLIDLTKPAVSTHVTKCRVWVPSYPRPHFCTYKVKEFCDNCEKDYCTKHYEGHYCG